jgi:hypothetical protein
MGKHRVTGERRWRQWGRRPDRDSLFDRSFRQCTGCGEDVYVLADDCRECGQELELVAG